MSRILIIEDEPALRLLLTRLLGSAGYAVEAVGTGAAGLRLALRDAFDLVVLDLMLPDRPGEQVMRALLAERPDANVLVLSSSPDAARRVAVLDGGASDYVGKPFVTGELLARVRLRMREHPPTGAPVIPIDGRTHLDAVRRTLVMDGARVPLSQREFALLSYLAQRRGAPCTRQELLADVWGLAFDPGTNVVDVYIGRLRAKLASATIETVRNVGYRLAAS